MSNLTAVSVILLLATSTQLFAQSLPARPGDTRPSVPATPRIQPLPEAEWTDQHRQLAAKWMTSGKPGNAFKTLLRTPDLIEGVMAFLNYVNAESTLPPRHRELLILRSAWLLNNNVIWSEHVPAAISAGFTAAEIRRIAEGPAARGWTPFEVTLLQLADQEFRNSSVTNALWTQLAATYTMHQQLDASLTVTDILSVSLLYNSLGIQPDATAPNRIPTDIPYKVTVPDREPSLRVARVEPLPTGPGLQVNRTFAQHPKMAIPRMLGTTSVGRGTKIDPRERELLILRTGWDAQSPYEWAAHVEAGKRAGVPMEKLIYGPEAPGLDPFDATLVRTADELYRDLGISDRTWTALAARYDEPKLAGTVWTSAWYRLVSIATTTLGVQLDPDLVRNTLPAVPR